MKRSVSYCNSMSAKRLDSTNRSLAVAYLAFVILMLSVFGFRSSPRTRLGGNFGARRIASAVASQNTPSV